MTGAPMRLSSAESTISPIDEHEQAKVDAPEHQVADPRAALGPGQATRMLSSPRAPLVMTPR